MPRAARMPMGVAAFPSPNRLAETLDAREESISLSRAERGKSRRKTGESARERASSTPARRNTSITPLQRQMSPPGLKAELHRRRSAFQRSRAGLGRIAGDRAVHERKQDKYYPNCGHVVHTFQFLLEIFVTVY